MAKRKNKRQSGRKIVMLNILLAVFLLMGIAYSILGSTLNMTGNVVVSKNRKTLYKVLQEETKNNGLAKEYMGNHQDSMNASESTKKIYHWYAKTDEEGTEILNKNNVIFADKCWQLIRTTDTGGARLLYNGEALNEQCLNDRPERYGLTGASYHTLAYPNSTPQNYYYATDYTYDSSTGTFHLAGEINRYQWIEGNYSSIIGKYTFFSTSQNSYGSQIVYVSGYKSEEDAYTDVYSSTDYSGVTIANYDSGTISGRYMYNKERPIKQKRETIPSAERIYEEIWYDDECWYADFYSYDSEANTYLLDSTAQQVVDGNYSAMIGKYTLRRTSSTSTSNTIYYIIDAVDDYYIALQLSNNTPIDGGTIYYIFDEYTDNGDGTYTISDPSIILKKDYYEKSGTMESHYMCRNAVSNVCEELLYVDRVNVMAFDYYNTINNYKYASDFTYENGLYHLNDNSVTIWNPSANISQLADRRYTCWNESGICEKISYVIQDHSGGLRYLETEDGQGIDDIRRDLLYADDLNVKDSTIKYAIDKWYEDEMIPYTKYLENTVYCNDKTITYITSWGVTNSLSPYIGFGNRSTLLCSNITDRFSVDNPKAKLTYPAALLSASEALLVSNSSARVSPDVYYLMSPSSIYVATNVYAVTKEGNVVTNYSGLRNVRPVVSLNPDVEYISGTGSMEDPYIVDAPPIAG